MSSISVGELRDILKEFPDDYMVVMQINTKHDTPAGKSFAYINGIKAEDVLSEVRLLN